MCSAGGTSDTSGGDGKGGGGNGGEEEVTGDERNGQSLGPEEYTRLARDGIQLMLNNRFTEAEELFRHHTQDNLHMAMGYCYLTFMVTRGGGAWGHQLSTGYLIEWEGTSITIFHKYVYLSLEE